jgi:hypothetical protein
MTKRTVLLSTLLALVMAAGQAPGQLISRDPGVRGGPAGAGGMIDGLTDTQKAVFDAVVSRLVWKKEVAHSSGGRR